MAILMTSPALPSSLLPVLEPRTSMEIVLVRLLLRVNTHGLLCIVPIVVDVDPPLRDNVYPLQTSSPGVVVVGIPSTSLLMLLFFFGPSFLFRAVYCYL
jgi:hypothetical protein